MNKPAKTQPAIKIEKLSKKYPGSDKFALDSLSLTIYPGEIYGFLGPNGAGKSTAIRMLLNFINPTSGSATIRGYDIVRDSINIRKSVGYLSGDFATYPKMTGKQFLAYMSDLQSSDNKVNISALAKRLNADLDKRLSDLSRGNRQKIAIIQAFMHEPKVLILDEPTSGLDPLVQETFHELSKEAAQKGACVFMSSHVLSEVQKMCDKTAIIREGRLVNETDLAEMATEAAQTFDIVFAGKVPVIELKKIKGGRLEDHKDNKVTLHMHGKLSPLFSLLAKYDVLSIDTRSLDLEEAFMRFYDNEKRKS